MATNWRRLATRSKWAFYLAIAATAGGTWLVYRFDGPRMLAVAIMAVGGLVVFAALTLAATANVRDQGKSLDYFYRFLYGVGLVALALGVAATVGGLIYLPWNRGEFLLFAALASFPLTTAFGCLLAATRRPSEPPPHLGDGPGRL